MPDFDSIEDVGNQPQANPPQFDDIKDVGQPDQAEQPKSFDDIEEAKPTSQFETPGQQLLTGVEGAGQGFAGPIATAAELGAHKIGLDKAIGIDTSAEAQAGRKEANPFIHGGAEAVALAGSMMTGTGEAGLLAKGAKSLLPEATSMLGKIGSSIIGNAIQAAGIQAGDEVSKAMIGQGDPEAPVGSALAHIGGAGLLGGLTGGMFDAVGQGSTRGLAAIENAKIGDKASNLLAGMGIASKAHAAGVPEKEAPEWIAKYFKDFGAGDEFNYKHYADGVKMYYSGLQKAVNKAADAVLDTGVGGAVGHLFGAAPAAVSVGLSQKYLAPIMEKVLNKPLIGATKLALPTVMYALSKGQTSGLFNALNYAGQVAKGAKAVTNSVESVFKAGGLKALDATEKDKQKIMDYIDNGGMSAEMEDSMKPNPPEQQFAEGGQVQQQPDNGSLGNLYPAQAMLMNAAKTRMSNYLGSLKPQPGPKRPFDPQISMAPQQRKYDRALSVAAAPLSVLNHIKDGTLRLEQVKHLTAMYPELHNHLSKKLTEGVMNAQAEGKPLPYKTRQSLSMFLGTELDSTMTPPYIMAAQSAFLPKLPQQPSGQPQTKTKKGTSTLGKSNNSYKTASQAAEADTTSRD